MKRHKVIFNIGLYLLQSTSIFSVSDEDLFMQGNQYFMQENYVQACDVYQSIENKGFAVLYNLELSFFNQGRYAQAFLYGKRAEMQASFQELTKLYDLSDCINRQINPDYAPSWYEQLAIFMKKCILSISMLLIQILLLITIILLMLCWYRRWYQVYVKFLICMIFCCIIFFCIWWYKTSMMEQKIGIVTKDLISVFAGPDESFYKKSELHESDEVIIISLQHGYYQIRTKQMIGWIHDNDIELV